MCTLSFLPLSASDFILSSNRDERNNRPTFAPQTYESLVYPKDQEAGGTWLALAPQKQQLCCLLNGAEEAHAYQGPYRKSRGRIILEVLAAPQSLEALLSYDFRGLEPCSIFFLDYAQGLALYLLRWNGKECSLQELSPQKAHIFSSSPLYTKPERQQRQERFFALLHAEGQEPNQAARLQAFHKKMNYQGTKALVQTSSFSQLELRQGQLRFYYEDYLAAESSPSLLFFSSYQSSQRP